MKVTLCKYIIPFNNYSMLLKFIKSNNPRFSANVMSIIKSRINDGEVIGIRYTDGDTGYSHISFYSISFTDHIFLPLNGGLYKTKAWRLLNAE